MMSYNDKLVAIETNLYSVYVPRIAVMTEYEKQNNILPYDNVYGYGIDNSIYNPHLVMITIIHMAMIYSEGFSITFWKQNDLIEVYWILKNYLDGSIEDDWLLNSNKITDPRDDLLKEFMNEIYRLNSSIINKFNYSSYSNNFGKNGPLRQTRKGATKNTVNENLDNIDKNIINDSISDAVHGSIINRRKNR